MNAPNIVYYFNSRATAEVVEKSMPVYINVAQIIVAVALIAVVLAQVRGGGLGGIFGQADTVYRTRRGLQKALVQLTIALVIVFIVISIIGVRIAR